MFLSILANAQTTTFSGLDSLMEKEAYEEVLTEASSYLENDTFVDEKYRLYSYLGDAYYYLGDTKNSLKAYLKLLSNPEVYKPENKRDLQEAYSYTGFLYFDLGLEEKSLEYHKKSLDLAIELNDSIEVAIAHYNHSTAYLGLGQLEEAMTHLKNAYNIDIALKDTSAIGFDLNAMGTAQMVSGYPRKAIYYYLESIELLEKSSGNNNSLGVRYNNLAKAYIKLEKWDSARYYTQASIIIHEELQDSVNLAERWINMAQIAERTENLNEAWYWANKAKNYFNTGLQKGNQLLATNEVLIPLLQKRNRNTEALTMVNESLAMARELRSLRHLVSLWELKLSILMELKKYPEAFEAFQKVRALYDSLNSEANRRIIEEVKVSYEVDKIESENEILRLEAEVVQAELTNKNQQLFWILLIGSVLLIASMVIILLLFSRSRIKARLLQSEINELRTKIKGLLEFKPEEAGIVKEQINNSLTDPLSDREFEILNLAISNKSNAEIAEQVFVSVNTVKFHLKNIYAKLGVADRNEALKYAIQASSN